MKRLITFSISFFFSGLLIGYTKAVYELPQLTFWNQYYYVWDKLKDVLLVMCIYGLLKEAIWKRAILAVIVFTVIRVLYQIADMTGIIIPYQEMSIFTMFIIAIFVTLYITQLQNVKRWRK